MSIDDKSEYDDEDFDSCISDEERQFYIKAYPKLDMVCERKVHCTICKTHIGTAPAQEANIKMHPVLRVTQCNKCHDFYNSGEFSKGEDGSELYCRWCGQGGEVYCCSSCPYVFCKHCIVNNLSRGVVADIANNENWNCFSCTSKILWPLRAQHWALIKYIEKQKREVQAINYTEAEYKQAISKDNSTCCRTKKAKSETYRKSDSVDSLDSINSKRSLNTVTKRQFKCSPHIASAPKRIKISNDEVVCTPDLSSMLEPVCQITVPQTPLLPSDQQVTNLQSESIAPICSSSQNFTRIASPCSDPPPLVLRNTSVQLRPVGTPAVRRQVSTAPQLPINSPGNTSPVYHTINGFRVDLNSASQQETFRLPNGKLIQVKRQSHKATNQQSQSNPLPQQQSLSTRPQSSTGLPANHSTPTIHSDIQRVPQQPAPIVHSTRPFQMVRAPANFQNVPTSSHGSSEQMPPQLPTQNIYQIQYQQQTRPTIMPPQSTYRYPNAVPLNMPNNFINGQPIQVINGTPAAPVQSAQSIASRPVLVKHLFPDTAIGQARSQLQDEVFNTMEVTQHLSNKLVSFTNSNAYKQARNYLDVKELYIHLSYVLSYVMGRYKGLQEQCLTDMRQLGFAVDADSLQNGQLAAATDYVQYNGLEDIDLFTTGSNSFHNQVYEYRKSLHKRMAKDDESTTKPFPEFIPLTNRSNEYGDESNAILNSNNDLSEDEQDPFESNIENEECETMSHMDNGDQSMLKPQEEEDDGNENDDAYDESTAQATEQYLIREKESHAYDRKLTRLIQQYPAIWCVRHPDYGNFEVTRKQWRKIATHFRKNDNIKLRWKNIRKRFVRIERRRREGKRFNGYVDKATNFLVNRELPMEEWKDVECGDEDETNKIGLKSTSGKITTRSHQRCNVSRVEKTYKRESVPSELKPIDVHPRDMKIINFVKVNPVLWRKPRDSKRDNESKMSQRTLWLHLWKYINDSDVDAIIDRWNELYEMYKCFRLKLIKDEQMLADMELKFAKYLAKLYFLYKIPEDDLRAETFSKGVLFGCDVDFVSESKMHKMPDDKKFVSELVNVVRQYSALWNPNDANYQDTTICEALWQKVALKLSNFQQKNNQSIAEDNDIEIVEPKTDFIDLDSDSEDVPLKNIQNDTNLKIVSVVSGATGQTFTDQDFENLPIFCIVPNSGASHESTLTATTSTGRITENEVQSLKDILLAPKKKQPRKKTTSKPNPTLIKQRELLEKERLQAIRPRDQKLKMQCAVRLRRAEREYPYVKQLLENITVEGSCGAPNPKPKPIIKNKTGSFGLARVKVVLKKIDQKIVDKTRVQKELLEMDSVMHKQKSVDVNEREDNKEEGKDKMTETITLQNAVESRDKELPISNESQPLAVDQLKETTTNVGDDVELITENDTLKDIDNSLNENTDKNPSNCKDTTFSIQSLNNNHLSSDIEPLNKEQNIEQVLLTNKDKALEIILSNNSNIASTQEIINNEENNVIGPLESISVNFVHDEAKDDNECNEIDPLAVEINMSVEQPTTTIDDLELHANIEDKSQENKNEAVSQSMSVENVNLDAISEVSTLEEIDSPTVLTEISQLINETNNQSVSWNGID